MNNSLWTNSTALPEFPTLQGYTKTDVLIIGGGIAGLLCAYMLTHAGVDCILVEADRICSGITKNTTAKITSQHGLLYHKLEKRFGKERAGLYLQISEGALGEYRRLCEDIDCDFSVQDNIVYSTDSAQLEAEWFTLHNLGFPAEFQNKLPVPVEYTGGICFHNQAQFHPLKFLAHIAKGLAIYEHSPVRELKGTTAIVPDGEIAAEKIIVATHFPFLNKHGSYFLKLYQQRSYVLALENAQPPEGMYIGSQPDSFSFRSYGDLLLLGGGGHRTGKSGGNWAALRSFAQAHYPDAKIVGQWATQDCMTLDGMPYIGQYSANTPNLYVTTGFNKWGMTNAMASAIVLRDLLLGKDTPWVKIFSPSRSILTPQLAVNGWESAGNLLRFSKKRCPHLGCALQWNPQEHSWDCPCHGSRFTADGKLIDNPATGDLKN